MDGKVGFAVGAEAITAPLLAPEIARWHLAQAENLSVEAQHHFRIERVVGDVANTRKLFFFALWNSEAFRRYAYRQTFRIVNPDLAVVNVVRFLKNHTARIEGEILSFDCFEVVDFQADVMQPEIHPHLAEGGASFEEGQIVKSVCNRNVSVDGSAQLLGSEKAMIKIRDLLGLIGEECNIAKHGHENLLVGLECWSNGVLDIVGGSEFGLSNNPVGHCSIIPILHHSNSISYILRKPFERQRMAEAFRFRQVIRGSADRREL